MATHLSAFYSGLATDEQHVLDRVNQGTARDNQPGRFLSFDGTSSVNVGDISNRGGVASVSFWLKADDITAHTSGIITLNASDSIQIVDGEITTVGFSGHSVTIYVDGAVEATIPDTTGWHHVAVVSDSYAVADTVHIGYDNTNYLTGDLFDIRMFDITLDADAVTSLSSNDGWNATITGVTAGEPGGGGVPDPPDDPPDPEPVPSEGWTTIPTADNTFYVSQSIGSDAYDGTSGTVDGGSVGPKQTLAAGVALMTAGQGDHLLLKKGDTWTEEQLLVGEDSGGTATDPWVFSSYGSGARPIISMNANNGIRCIRCSGHVWFISLHCQRASHTGESKSGFSLIGPGNTFLMEDCKINNYGSGLSVDGPDSGDQTVKMTIRRCLIHDNYKDRANGHAQGMFADNIATFVFEENFLHHNGWETGTTTADATGPTQFNHNCYFGKYIPALTFRNNILSEASSAGLKDKPIAGAHYITDNVFVRNGFGLTMWSGKAGRHPPVTGAAGYCEGNLFCEGLKVASDAFGVTLANLSGGYFKDNWIVNKTTTTGWQSAISLQDWVGWETEGVGVHDFEISGNIIKDWEGSGISFAKSLPFSDDGATPEADVPQPLYSNITVTGNNVTLATVNDKRSLMRFHDLTYIRTKSNGQSYGPHSVTSNITFGSNKYHLTGGTKDYQINDGDVSFATWQSTLGDTTSTEGAVSYVDGSRDVTAYVTDAAELNLADYDAFVTAWKGFGKDSTWPTDHQAAAIITWVSAGFVES